PGRAGWAGPDRAGSPAVAYALVDVVVRTLRSAPEAPCLRALRRTRIHLSHGPAVPPLKRRGPCITAGYARRGRHAAPAPAGGQEEGRRGRPSGCRGLSTPSAQSADPDPEVQQRVRPHDVFDLAADFRRDA